MIGIDIEEIDRFRDWEDGKLNRIFARGEIEYAKSHVDKCTHLCGFFCVKEALVKALDYKELQYNQIEVGHTDTGNPYIVQNQYFLSIQKKFNIINVEISISHCQTYAVAICTLTF